ncbi:cell division protein FtsA [Buchnera aphidicola]|uniref:cell division protein FtsA n=1 Tax=Buchnera aphidicola TaxID=9 RepID=UPI003463FBBF
MMNQKQETLVAGLEIGTTKVVVLIGKILENNNINIVGIGKCSSKGISVGNINDLNSVTKCIKKSIDEAEKTAQCNISSIYLSLSNKYIQCKNETGIVPIHNNEVTTKDVQYAIYTAKSIKLNYDYNILHVIPQEYAIDQEQGIKNPIGLSGFRMTANVHLITYRNHIKKNIIKAVKNCNLKIKKIIFSGLASSQAILTSEEKSSGVCMIDIGGGSIEIVIYTNGYIQHSEVIPYAGNTITNDIACIFNTSFKNAEMIKIKYGSTVLSSFSIPELIEFSNLNGMNTKKIKKDILIEIIESRYSELLNIINDIIIKIQKKLFYSKQPYLIGSGIVITGGSAQTKSLKCFAEKIFKMPVRIGVPNNVKTNNQNILHPSYSTVIGLLKYSQKKYHYQNHNKTFIFKKWIYKIQNWFQKISNKH